MNDQKTYHEANQTRRRGSDLIRLGRKYDGSHFDEVRGHHNIIPQRHDEVIDEQNGGAEGGDTADPRGVRREMVPWGDPVHVEPSAQLVAPRF